MQLNLTIEIPDPNEPKRFLSISLISPRIAFHIFRADFDFVNRSNSIKNENSFFLFFFFQLKNEAILVYLENSIESIVVSRADRNIEERLRNLSLYRKTRSRYSYNNRVSRSKRTFFFSDDSKEKPLLIIPDTILEIIDFSLSFFCLQLYIFGSERFFKRIYPSFSPQPNLYFESPASSTRITITRIIISNSNLYRLAPSYATDCVSLTPPTRPTRSRKAAFTLFVPDEEKKALK